MNIYILIYINREERNHGMDVRWNYPPCIRRRHKECLPLNTTLVFGGFIPGFSVTRIPDKISPVELFYALPLLTKPKLCFVKYPRMVFTVRPWFCSSQSRQCNALVCAVRGLRQAAPHRGAGSHLDPLLLQVNAICQVLAGDDVRVLVLVEQRLQGLQLVLSEYGAMPACPALDLVESLQLTGAPLGALVDPDR